MLAAGLSLVLFALLIPGAAGAYHHHSSKVRFQEYSVEAFEAARRDGRPVFMLISAVWCYWCRHFEQNTLETEEVADYLNRRYVNVFVDHDLRLDLARRYVRGLPMIVLFDPDGRVRQSFSGSLRKEDFLAVLTRVEGEVGADLAKARPADLPPVTAALPEPVPVSVDTYRQFLDGAMRYFDDNIDTVYGGFGLGTKHPHGRLLAYLLERGEVSRDPKRLEVLDRTLKGILRGIWDPVEGGFFRYAGGRDWSGPYFEKMLYVNASLLVAFDRAARITPTPRYRQVADATAAYLLGTLYDPKAGGFYGSQTADPAYYGLPPQQRSNVRPPPVNKDKLTAWNAEAVVALLTVGQATGRQDLKDAAFRSLDFMRRHLVTDKGVYHLYEYKTGQGRLRGQLHANAWAALAFLEGHRVSGRAVYREAAARVLAYALAELFDPQRGAFWEANNPDDRGALPRVSEIPLEANGVMAEALVRAHKATGRGEYLEAARRVLAALGGRVKTILADDVEESAGVSLAQAVSYLRAYGELLQGT